MFGAEEQQTVAAIFRLQSSVIGTEIDVDDEFPVSSPQRWQGQETRTRELWIAYRHLCARSSQNINVKLVCLAAITHSNAQTVHCNTSFSKCGMRKRDSVKRSVRAGGGGGGKG